MQVLWQIFDNYFIICFILGLLGTGPKKTYNLEPPGFDSSSISSDPESVDDIWSINDEQREYYVKQFMLMQPDVTGSILGRSLGLGWYSLNTLYTAQNMIWIAIYGQNMFKIDF